jgi:hypothetical protein
LQRSWPRIARMGTNRRASPVAPTVPPGRHSCSFVRFVADPSAAVRVTPIYAGDAIELLEGLLYRKSYPDVPTPVGMVDVGSIFPLTPAQFRLMGRAGILSDDDNVELIEGVIYNHMTILPPHTGTVIRLNGVLKPLMPAGWRYRQEQPIVLFDGEPIPDGVIATGSDDDNFRFHPLARDVDVAIEVADSSLLRDRTIKLRSYAHAGIPVYWNINLIDRQVEVHTDPDPLAVPGPTYRRREV